MTEVNKALARKVLEVVDAGLAKGVGLPEPGKMCVEAAVCYAMGLPHGDNPSCVAPTLRRLKICLNDANWSSNESRASGLRRLAIAQLGSDGALNEKEFVHRVATMAIKTSVSDALTLAANICKDEKKRNAMLAAAKKCSKEGTREAAFKGRDAATSVVAYAAAAAAYSAATAAAAYSDSAATYAAAAAAYSAAYSATAATYAAYAAEFAADAAYSATAADYASKEKHQKVKAKARDKVLSKFAEGVVQILIDMKAPGCKWLNLAKRKRA